MEHQLIAINTICTHYDIEVSFINELEKTGLIQIEFIEEQHYIHQDKISDLEKMIRLYHELNVNLEGIDVVFNFLEKEKALRQELNELKNRLSLYERD